MSEKPKKLYTSLCNEKTLQSADEGFFFEFAKLVCTRVGDDWIKSQFAKLKTDGERVKAIFNDPKVKENVCNVLQNVQLMYRQKNASVSRERRLIAEKLFKDQSDLKNVLMISSQAVLRAPANGVDIWHDGGFSLSYALWTRSQILFQMQEYAMCLTDMQIALKEGVPNTLKFDVYAQMAKCYRGLNEPKKADISFRLAEKLIEKNSNRLELFQKQMQEVKINVKSTKKTDDSVLNITGKRNKAFKNASELIRIKDSKELGRHAVASKEIVAGNVLIIETPHASCLMPEFFGSHCQHCFKKIIAPIGCNDCSGVAFCSVECRNTALNSYHKFECKILDFLIGSGMSALCYLALRMITKFSLAECLEFHKNKSNIPIYKLCTLASKREASDFLNRTIMASFLLRCLQKVNFFPSRKEQDDVTPTDEELKIGELLLLHLQILQFNAYEIMDPCKLPDKNPIRFKEKSIALAIYQTASLLNHSCYPAVTRCFLGDKIVIVANQQIKAGDLIAENYGPIASRFKLSDRRQALESRYWFQCNCQACQEDWPYLSDIDETFAKLKCTTNNCSGIFTLPDISGNCLTCNQDVNLDDSLVILSECENQYKEAYDSMQEDNFKNAVDIYCDALTKFHKVAIPPHIETQRAQENLKTCLYALIWERISL